MINFERQLYEEGLTSDCALLVATAFGALIDFNLLKEDLELKGYIVRSNGSGSQTLFDSNNVAIADWVYDEATKKFIFPKRQLDNYYIYYSDDKEISPDSTTANDQS